MLYDELPSESESYHLRLRYQDSISSDALAIVVASGPRWYKTVTPFRTPRNADPVLWHDGVNGKRYASCDGGNWWFEVIYKPRALSVNTTYGFRINHADKEIRRAGLTSGLRVLPKKWDVVEWPDPVSLSTAYKSKLIQHRILIDVNEVISNGYTCNIDETDGESLTNWISLPTAPTTEPNAQHYQEYSTLFSSDHATWSAAKTLYDSDMAAYSTFISTPFKCILKNGRVWRIRGPKGTGLAPFYDELDNFIGWGLVHETRCVLIDMNDNTVTTPWIGAGAGILTSLDNYDDIPLTWKIIKRSSFSPNIDPRHQIPEIA